MRTDLLRRLLALSEFSLMYALGKLFGISIVIRYLRNPNPLTTAKLLRAFRAKVGENSSFKRAFVIDNAFEDQNSKGDFRHLSIGNNCYIGDEVYIDLANQVLIEDNVVISGRVSLITHSDCNRSPSLSELFPRKCDPIRIQKGAWVGFDATVLAGVTVGSNAVVAAKSLLKENAEPNSVYAGIPAKPIKVLSTQK